MSSKKQTLIAQGAEAKIFLVGDKETSLNSVTNRERWVGVGGGSSEVSQKRYIIKDRIKKSYRLPELDDKIRRLRTKKEAKLLEKVGKIIPSPKVLKIENSKIEIEFINGLKLSQHLDEFPLTKQKQILKQIGIDIAKLHNENIIHGDLTTSNMIYVDNLQSTTISPSKIFFIDFGLGFHSHKIEDKAVDLHLLKQALEAKHFKNWKDLFKEFVKGYKNQKVLEQLKKVEARGRYKERY